MEEQGMATSNRFSTTDLATLSGMVRVSEILTESLGGKVRTRLEKLAGHRPRRESGGLQKFGTTEATTHPHHSSTPARWNATLAMC